MTAPLFLVEPARLDSAAATGSLLLDGAEGRHAARVRRIGVGERVDVADGEGRLLACAVAAAGRDSLTLSVEGRREEPAPQPCLVVVQALAKGERGEQAVEVMTEAGVDVVVPWAAQRCVTQWRGERGERSLQRWRAVAREAAKQARRPRVPQVRALASTAEVGALLGAAAAGVVLHEEAAAPLAGLALPQHGDIVVVVGPEGGVSAEELAAFAAVGAEPVRLGPTVLRTSTAGVAAVAVLSARTGRWG